jgi:hypothetical protein
MATFPPAAEAFGALAGVLQRALREQGGHGVYFSNWHHGGTSVVAVNAQGEAVVDTVQRSAHQQMAWAALEREAHKAYKVFQKACRPIPHLHAQAKCLAFTLTGPHRAQVAWEWGNLNFTQGLASSDAPIFPLSRVQKAIAAVEKAQGEPVPVFFHNRHKNIAIGRAQWPLDGARGFLHALFPRDQLDVVGFRQTARFTRSEAKQGFHATTPDQVGAAFRALQRSLQAAPGVVQGAYMEWTGDQLHPVLELRRPRSDRHDKVSAGDAWNHPRLAGNTWLADCASAAARFHQALQHQAPCMAKVLTGAPLAVGFFNKQHPYVHVFGMQIHQHEDLCFLGHPPATLRAFHTTQGGAQHFDVPAPTAELAAAFVRAKRNNGQLIEVWTAL